MFKTPKENGDKFYLKTATTMQTHIQRSISSKDSLNVEDWACPQSGSTGDNWKTYTKTSPEQNNSKKLLQEMRLLLKTLPNLEEVTNDLERFSQDYLSTIKQTYKSLSDSSHANTLIRNLAEISFQLYESDNFLLVLTNEKFINSVLSKLAASGSNERRKTLLRKLYNLYFDNAGYTHLDPVRCRCLNLINFYGQQRPNPKKKEITIHPKVDAFLNHLTEKGFKWHKRARLNTTEFLKWLAATNYVKTDNFLSIDVRQVTHEIANTYKDYLDMKVGLKQIQIETAQLKIQSLRQWFSFLKAYKHILKNSFNLVENFHLERKETSELLPLETVKKFFEVLWDDKDALKWLSLFITIASHGLRSIEALTLTRNNIDFQRNMIQILRKGGDYQWISITGLTALFLELYIKSAPDNKDALVWKSQIGGALHYGSVLYYYKKFISQAGIKNTVGATHFFRHLLISELALQTMDLEAIKQLAGDKDIKHLDPYFHVRKSQLKRNVKEKMITMGVEDYGFI